MDGDGVCGGGRATPTIQICIRMQTASWMTSHYDEYGVMMFYLAASRMHAIWSVQVSNFTYPPPQQPSGV
jgi:hypothetical protein